MFHCDGSGIDNLRLTPRKMHAGSGQGEMLTEIRERRRRGVVVVVVVLVLGGGGGGGAVQQRGWAFTPSWIS